MENRPFLNFYFIYNFYAPTISNEGILMFKKWTIGDLEIREGI